ncbi:MAG: DNA internalization-related competence protein ComEC/Rec2 [Actinobacteria bacterium]|nr:DNA internalization-related competence protein ComEC/Rec2 [Actinomycetota bacterium]
MSAWALPALAAGLWAGLLVRPWIGERVDAWVWLVGGALALAVAVALAPSAVPGSNTRRRSVRGPLERAGLVSDPAGDPAGGLAFAAGTPSVAAWGSLVLSVVAVTSVAIGWGSVHEHRVRDALVARLAPDSVTVEGSLRVDPKADDRGWSAVFDVRTVTWPGGAAEVRESVWLAGRDAPPDALRGDRLRVSGSLEVPEEGGFASFLGRRGIAAELSVDDVEWLGHASFAPIRWSRAVRTLIGDSIVEMFPPREAGLLLGLALGDDTELDPVLERDFRASGLSHLLVVSGGNVAMVLAPVVALGALLRLSRWPRFALGALTVAFFVVLTGAEPSVMRAGVMAGLALVGVLLGRPRSGGSILAGAVVLLLVLDPALVWSVGFQLSVAATAGMIAMATPIADRLRFLPRPVALATGATLAAQAGVTPILLFHFHEVPTSTVLANVLAFPAVAPCLLLGVSAAGAGLASEGLGQLVAGIAVVPLRYLETVADRLAQAPVPWITGGGAVTLAAGLAAVLLIAWWMRSGRPLPRRAVVFGVLLAPLLVWSSAISAGPPTSLTVRFFDVGQGDAALITSPGGASILVDGGPEPADIATELAALGIKRLDLVVASHPHADHIVGLPAVLSRIPVGSILEPGCPGDSPDAETLAEAVAAEGVPGRHPRAGEVILVGDVRLEILSPDRCWSGTESDSNNDALVIRASIGEDVVLFATEPEEPAQQVMLDEEVDLAADVLKVPHHGAATSLETFFEAVGAEVAVVSVGPNTYGHPVPEVLDWLRSGGTRVVRTDLFGTVVVTFDEGGVLVESAS